ncbi:hypothetical protein N8843_11155 [Verrucomicrobia bacterium]|nr:hypothetical protein [Verrucomicrobiota bacterium]MDA7629176.1 hypothetical protein [Verrucomicrobiota bacterium]
MLKPTISAHIRQQHGVNGSLHLTISKCGDEYVLEYEEGLSFRINPFKTGRDAVHYLGRENSNPKYRNICEHLIKNQITPLLRAWNGSVVFHASAVIVRGLCWGFLGKSGAGKSTLAKSLSKHEYITHLSDDWLEARLADNQPKVLNNPFSTRLESSHAHALAKIQLIAPFDTSLAHFDGKLLLESDENLTNNLSTQLGLLCELIPCSPEKEPSLIKLNSLEAFRCISKHLYRLDTSSTEHLKKEFSQLTNLVQFLPVYRLHYPHSLADLKTLHQTLINKFVD